MREPDEHSPAGEMPSGFGVPDDHLLVIVQDGQLARLMDGAAAALARLGLTSDDLLADPPAAGEEAMRRVYGDDLIDDLLAVHARTRASRDE